MMGAFLCELVLLLLIASCFGLPIIRWLERKPTLDRIAWVSFGAGMLLMFYMALYGILSEGDGDFRTWDTIRRHKRIFFAGAALAVIVPAAVFLAQKLPRPFARTKPLGSAERNILREE
jgi:hypothetical protein